jgi:hypothetical protein
MVDDGRDGGDTGLAIVGGGGSGRVGDDAGGGSDSRGD